MNGWQLIVRFLESQGVDVVFGLPGTQNAELFSELADAGVRIVSCSHEMSAGFAAIGYATAGVRPAVLLTIAGPGFCYAMTPIVEASHDSVPILHIVVRASSSPSGRFALQDMDHGGVARAFAVDVVESNDSNHLLTDLETAWRSLRKAEPGPVILLLDAKTLNGPQREMPVRLTPGEQRIAGASLADSAAGMAVELSSGKVGVIVGRGAAGAAAELQALVEEMGWPVMTTVSGRGILPESHPLNARADRHRVEAVQALFDSCDRILILGAKLSHNSTFGFRLKLQAEKLVHVDQSQDVLTGRYDAAVKIEADAAAFITALASAIEGGQSANGDRECRMSAADPGSAKQDFDLHFDVGDTLDAEAYFASIQAGFADDAIWVTDSGMHQFAARQGLVLDAPNRLIAPVDFQSMGFGLPAAIGASIAEPDAEVVVIHGDGGFQMVAMDLLTAVRLRCKLRLVVMDDGSYSLIDHQQRSSGLTASTTSLPGIDYSLFARAAGAGYVDASSGLQSVFDYCENSDGPVLIRQRVCVGPGLKWLYARKAMRGRIRKILGPKLLARLRGLR